MNYLSAIAVTAWSGLIGAIEVAIYAYFSGQLYYTPLDSLGYMSFAFVVICGGVGSMLFWNIGVKNAGPSIAAIFSNLTPIFGMICGAIFLKEDIGYIQLSGALFIFLGVYITTHSQKIINVHVKHLKALRKKFLRLFHYLFIFCELDLFCHLL